MKKGTFRACSSLFLNEYANFWRPLLSSPWSLRKVPIMQRTPVSHVSLGFVMHSLWSAFSRNWFCVFQALEFLWFELLAFFPPSLPSLFPLILSLWWLSASFPCYVGFHGWVVTICQPWEWPPFCRWLLIVEALGSFSGTKLPHYDSANSSMKKSYCNCTCPEFANFPQHNLLAAISRSLSLSM